MHLMTAAGVIKGVLYPGQAKNKWSQPNSPTVDKYVNVDPKDFALIDQLPNEKEAGQFMLHQVDFDPEARQILPTVPDAAELTTFRTGGMGDC